MKTKKLTLTLILTLSLILSLNFTKADENIYFKIDILVKNNKEKAETFYKALGQIYNYTGEKLGINKYEFDYSDLYGFNLEGLNINELTFSNNKNNFEENNFGNDRYIKINFDRFTEITIYNNYKNSDNTINYIINNFNNIKTGKTDIKKDDFLEKGFLFDGAPYAFQGYPKYQKLIKNINGETIGIGYYAFQGQDIPGNFVYYALFVKDNSILVYKTIEFGGFDGYFFIPYCVSNTQDNECYIENLKETKFNYDEFYKKYLNKGYFYDENYSNFDFEDHYKKINETIKIISDNN